MDREIDGRATEIERQIEGFRSKDYVDFDRLRLWGKLLMAQQNLESRIDCRKFCPALDQKVIGVRTAKGLPAIEIDELCLNDDLLRELLRAVCELPGESPVQRVARQLFSAESSGKIPCTEFIRRSMAGDWAMLRPLGFETEGEQAEGFGLLALILAAPFFRRCAQTFQARKEFDYPSSASCPVCGGPPLMARLGREDGKRCLVCAVCYFSWGLERLKCPFCGNADPHTLGYYVEESQPAYRLDTCEVCRRYIKTVDERRLDDEGPAILTLTDLATFYLDVLAEKKGYLTPERGRDREGDER